MTSNQKCKYQDQNSTQTLAEGVQEYYAANPHLLDASKADPETASFFTSHDRIHVVFGLNTSVAQEGMADLWTIFGTDVGLIKYVSYLKNPELKKIAKMAVSDFNSAGALNEVKKLGVNFVKVFFRSRQMKKKWQWTKNDSCLDQKLVAIRKEFGITLV